MATIDMLNAQKEYFKTGETLSYKFRRTQLKKLREAIISNETKILKALKEDLGKNEIEGYMCEVGLVLGEIDFILKNMKKYMRRNRVLTGLANFPAKSYTKAYPKGSILIMSPWNYPFMLTIEPLVDAMAAGNTAIVKPSAYSPATSQVIFDLLTQTFKPEYINVVMGGRAVNQDLLTLPFEHIFFTGSKTVGHEVLKQAEKNMVPVTLELGGKSPCIVTESAKIKLAAKRIVFGKFMNVGQTCVAPDYVLVHESVKDELLKEIINQIKVQYGESPLEDDLYGKIISEKHFNNTLKFLENQEITYGGKSNAETLKIEPTIIDGPSLDSLVMQEEIFAPILPIVTYKTLEEALKIIRRNDTPLALYLFTEKTSDRDFFFNSVQFGGGCLNDTIMHLATSRLAFGGVGESGLGAYHGKRGFDTFSHYKSIVEKSTTIDVPVRYRPHTKFKRKIIEKML